MAVNGGSIYITGLFAAPGSTEEMHIIKTQNGNVYCTGYRSCRSMYMKNSNKVYCNGNNACRLAKFDGTVKDVLLYGYAAGNNTLVDGISGNLYCVSSYGCIGSNISNVGENVYGIGGLAVQGATINNVNGYVIAVGVQSLADGSISNCLNVKYLFYFVELFIYIMFNCFYR